ITGFCQHIVTRTDDLVARDAKAMAGMFAAIGADSTGGYIVDNMSGGKDFYLYDHNAGRFNTVSQEEFFANARWAVSTYYNLNFISQEQDNPAMVRAFNTPGTRGVWIDEFDTVALNLTEKCVISGETDSAAAKELAVMEKLHELMAAGRLAELEDKGALTIRKAKDRQKQVTLTGFPFFGGKARFGKMVSAVKAGTPELADVPFDTWVRMMEALYTAKFSWEKGRDYEIRGGDVVPRDAQTDLLMFGREMADISDALRLLNGIGPRGKKETISERPISEFLSLASFTGTDGTRNIGGTSATGARTVGELYTGEGILPEIKVISEDAVGHDFRNNRQEVPIIASADEAAAREKLLEELKKDMDAGQIIKVRVEDAETVAELVRTQIPGATVQVLAGDIDSATKEAYVANAGKRGVITIIDNANVRGTSPRIDEENGNWEKGIVLHLLYPEDFDIEEEQLVGRIARAGEPGLVKRHYNSGYFRGLRDRQEGTEAKSAIDGIIEALNAYNGDQGAENAERLSGAIERYKNIRFNDRIARDMRELEPESTLQGFRGEMTELSSEDNIRSDVDAAFDDMMSDPDIRNYYVTTTDRMFLASQATGDAERVNAIREALAVTFNMTPERFGEESINSLAVALAVSGSADAFREIMGRFVRASAAEIAFATARKERTDFLTKKEIMRREMNALSTLSGAVGTPLEAQRDSLAIKLGEDAVAAVKTASGNAIFTVLFGRDEQQASAADHAARLRAKGNVFRAVGFLLKAAVVIGLIYLVNNRLGLADMLKAQAEGGIGRNEIIAGLNNLFPFLGGEYVSLLMIAAVVILIGVVAFSKTYLKKATAHPKPVEDIIKLMDGTYRGNKAKAVGSFVLYQFVLSLLGFLATAAAGALAVAGVVAMITSPASMVSLSGIFAGAVFAGIIALAAKGITYYIYSSKKELSPEDLSRGYSRLDTGALLTGLVSAVGVAGSAFLMKASPVAGGIGLFAIIAALIASRAIARKFHGDEKTFDRRALTGYGLALLVAAPALALIVYSGGAWFLSGAMLQFVAVVPFAIKIALTLTSSYKLSMKMSSLEKRLLEKPRLLGFAESAVKISMVSFVILLSAWAMATTTIPGMIWGKHALSLATWLVAGGVALTVIAAIVIFFMAASASRGRSKGLIHKILENATARQGLAMMGVGSAISIMGPQIAQETVPVQVHAEAMERLRTLNQQDQRAIARDLSRIALAATSQQPLAPETTVTTEPSVTLPVDGPDTAGGSGLTGGATGSGPMGGTPPVVIEPQAVPGMPAELSAGLDRINALMAEATIPGAMPQDVSDKLAAAARILRELAPEHPEVLSLMGENTRNILASRIETMAERPADLASGMAEVEKLMEEISQSWDGTEQATGKIARVSSILRGLAPKYPNIFELFGQDTRAQIAERIFPDMNRPLEQQPAALRDGINRIETLLNDIAEKKLAPAGAKRNLDEASRTLRELAETYPGAMALLGEDTRSALAVQLVAIEGAAGMTTVATAEPAPEPAAAAEVRPALAADFMDNAAGLLTAEDISEIKARAEKAVAEATAMRDEARKELEERGAGLDEVAQTALKDRIDEAEVAIQRNNAYIAYFTELGTVIGKFEAPVQNARKAYDGLVAGNSDEKSRVEALLALLRLERARVQELAQATRGAMSEEAVGKAGDISSLGETVWHEATRTNVPVFPVDTGLDDAAMAQVRALVVLEQEADVLGYQIEGLEAISAVREDFVKIEALIPRIERALDARNDEEAAPLIREMMTLVGDLGSRGMKTMEPINMESLRALDRIMMRFISVRQEMISTGVMKLNRKDARRKEIDRQLFDLRTAVLSFREDVETFRNEGEYRLALSNLERRMGSFVSGLTAQEKEEMRIEEHLNGLNQTLEQAQAIIEAGFRLETARENAREMEESLNELQRQTAAARAREEAPKASLEVLPERAPATVTYADDKETYEVLMDGYAFIRMDGRHMVDGALDGERAWHHQTFGLLERRDLIYSTTSDMRDMVGTTTLTEDNGRQVAVRWMSAEPQGEDRIRISWRETYLDRGREVSKDHAYTYQMMPISRGAGNLVLRMTQGNKKDVMNYRYVADRTELMRLIRRGYRVYDRQGAPVYSDSAVELARKEKYQEAIIQDRMDRTAARH
ncbi:MAG: hypothetical protein PHY34_06445, partial [Patescibacteria group bacterium]|nr:hypothetical protein [Patescibacteria group bacterium]